MNRLAALLLVAIVAAAVVAAPAPFPRRGRGPWVDGWDKPADPTGECRFDRRGERLMVTFPGRTFEFDAREGHFGLVAPRFLRKVEGDFAVEVRVGTDVLRSGGSAGLLLVSEDKGFLHSLGPRHEFARLPHYCTTRRFDLKNKTLATNWRYVELPGKTVALCLERRGRMVVAKANLDGLAWQTWDKVEFGAQFPRKLKVGVFVAAPPEGRFTATFDNFKLASLSGKTG
jgi:regulation of enolase protein 1 (concanavalin A-like superfamily)